MSSDTIYIDFCFLLFQELMSVGSTNKKNLYKTLCACDMDPYSEGLNTKFYCHMPTSRLNVKWGAVYTCLSVGSTASASSAGSANPETKCTKFLKVCTITAFINLSQLESNQSTFILERLSDIGDSCVCPYLNNCLLPSLAFSGNLLCGQLLKIRHDIKRMSMSSSREH